MPPKQEEIPEQQEAVETTSDPKTLKPTEKLPEPVQLNKSTKVKLQTERNEFELTGRITKDHLPPEERLDAQQRAIASSKAVGDAAELKPPSGTEKILEARAHEKQEPLKTTELFDLEKTVTIELPEEKEESEESFRLLPEETTLAEAFQEPGPVLPNSR